MVAVVAAGINSAIKAAIKATGGILPPVSFL
jgi:hypothetical protein